MSGDGERRQRAVMATDAEWERIGRAAASAGMDRSRFVVHRTVMAEPLPAEVLRRAVREMLVQSALEERRLPRTASSRLRPRGSDGRSPECAASRAPEPNIRPR